MQVLSRRFIVAMGRHDVTQGGKQPLLTPSSLLVTIGVSDANRIHENKFYGLGGIVLELSANFGDGRLGDVSWMLFRHP
jgi:hypothetical protein